MTTLTFPTDHPVTAPARPVVRISDLRQWIYCPRVIWWTQVCPVGKYVSYKMRQGLLKERRLQHLQKRRTLQAFGLRDGRTECNVDLYSPSLGLAGRLDLMIRTGEQRIPVEIKFTRGPAQLNHRVQLAGYALLIEDLFGVPVPHGYVMRLPDNTVEKIQIDPALSELTQQTIRAVRKTIRDEAMPPASPILAKCSDCEYRIYCGDVAR